MIKFTPEEVAKVPQYSAESTKLSKQIMRLTQKRDKLNEKIGALMDITEFFEGGPIRVQEEYLNPQALRVSSPVSARYAKVYHNANTPKTTNKWGIRLEAEAFTHYGGKFLGANFTKDGAMLLAKRWVVIGTIPGANEAHS